MLTIRAECTGITPILVNPCDPVTLFRPRVRVEPDRRRPHEIAEAKLIIDGDRFGILTDCLYAALVGAGRKVQMKAKRQVTSNDGGTFLYRFLNIPETFLAFPPGATWTPDKRKGRDPRTYQRVRIVRPRFDRWGFACTVQIREDRIHPMKVRDLFDIAGDEFGLGDFRPNGEDRLIVLPSGKPAYRCPFGRFTVTEWEIEGDGSAVPWQDERDELFEDDEVEVPEDEDLETDDVEIEV